MHVLLAGLLLAPTTATITVPLAIEQFEQLDRSMMTLSAQFTQSVQGQTAQGTFSYRKKDLLRIEHLLPEKQTLVCDGKRVWVWRPANGQVLRSSLADWKRSQPLAQALLDFGNYAKLLRRYEVSIGTVAAPQPDGHRTFTLVLKPHSSAEGDFLLTLRLSTRDFFPFESELRAGSVVTRTTFSALRFNAELPDALFRFTPPPGADILDFPVSAP